MDTKKQASHHPMGMCEKLYTAFQPTLQPLRRLTFRQHEAPQPLPQPAPPQKENAQLPKSQHNHKAKGKKIKAQPLPSPAPPKGELMPMGVVPETVPPLPAKKGINERVDDYIESTKRKIRTGSGLGRLHSSK